MNETFDVPKRPPDYADVYSGILNNPNMTAREMLKFSLSRSPGWFKALHKLRNLLVSPFGLKTGLEDGNHGSVDILEQLPVVYETEAELASGLSDKHLDFLMTVARDDASEPRVTITTQIWFNRTMGKAYLIAVLPFHKAIIRHYVRELGKAA